MTVASGSVESSSERVIGGRYRVEERIATGGMGVVYRVIDETNARPLALKRLLLRDNEEHARRVPMFEREFHTLARLAHPRIIEVYEYGSDEEGPYYTMELLDGADLRHLAPLPYAEACAFLRDVASSLALLHTRRLLHRDVSPRNVRRTGDGRCKLLDFGTMTPFGTPEEVAGTPPFVPPEALHGLALDQRTDLYGLGALAYFLLTGRHAYGAEHLSGLQGAWNRAAEPPSRWASDVPEPLDRLVMSLLNLDPLARPPNAAAVIDALSVIGGLTPEDHTSVGQSYFLGSRLVGRAPVVRHLEDALRSALASCGKVVLVEGGRGLGKSRMLDELMVHGQTRGAVVARVQCERDPEPYGVMKGIARSLQASRPRAAKKAAETFAALGALLPELGVRQEMGDLDNPTERRARLQRALTEWVCRLADEHPIVICVDDLQDVDEASAAVLLALGHRAIRTQLLLVLTLRPKDPTQAQTALDALRPLAGVVELERFNAAQTLELCRSLFGDVVNVERLATRLFEATGGNPLACMEVVRALTSSGVIRYADGMWVVPGEFPEGSVAASLDEAMDARVRTLEPGSLRLARRLSLYGGKASLSLCRAIASSEQACFWELDDLVSQEILIWHEDAYRFSRDALRDALVRSIPTEDLAGHHRVVGEALAKLGTDAPAVLVEAGWHLVAGGAASRGAELLERGASVQFTDGMASAIRALEAALEVFEREGRPLETILPIRSKLVGAAFPVDRRLAEKYGQDTLRLLLEHTGLDVALRARGRFGPRLALFAGLGAALARRAVTPPKRRGPPVKDAFALFLPVLGSMLGVASTCLDVERAEHLVSLVEPLTGFGKRHIGSEFYAHTCRFLTMVQGREAEAHESSLRFLEQLNQGEGILAMSEEMRVRWKGGSWIVRGQMEVFRDGRGALDCAEELERLGFEFHRAWAHQIRMLYHAMRGEMHLAEPHRRALDVHFVRNGSVWQLEVGPSVSLCAAHGLVGDVTRLKQTLEHLDRTARSIPSLRLYCDLVRMSYRTARGDFVGGLEMYEALKSRLLPRRHIGWPAFYTYAASAMRGVGDHERAKEICLEALSHVRPADRAFVALYLPLERQLAMTEASLGNLDVAAASLDALIAEHGPRRGPLTCGTLHEDRARVALMAGETERFREHAIKAEEFYRPTRHPILIGRSEVLWQLGGTRAVDSGGRASPDAATVVDGAFEGASSYPEAAERALTIVLRHHGRKRGYLFGWDGNDIWVAAAASDETAPPELIDYVRGLLNACAGDLATEMIDGPEDTEIDGGPPPGYETAVLALDAAHELQTVGVVAMDREANAGAAPDYSILRAVARRLATHYSGTG